MKLFLFKNTLFALSIFAFSACNSSNVDMVEAEQEANEFIQNQFNFWVNNSYDEAKSYFDSNAVLIGTDAGEYLSNWEEIGPSIEQQLEAIQDVKFEQQKLKVTLSNCGDMAAFTSVTNFKGFSGEEKFSIENVRSSGVVKKTNGQWKMIQIHWSIGREEQVIEY